MRKFLMIILGLSLFLPMISEAGVKRPKIYSFRQYLQRKGGEYRPQWQHKANYSSLKYRYSTYHKRSDYERWRDLKADNLAPTVDELNTLSGTSREDRLEQKYARPGEMLCGRDYLPEKEVADRICECVEVPDAPATNYWQCEKYF